MEFRCSAIGKLLQKKFIVVLVVLFPLCCLLSIGPVVSGRYFAIPIIVAFVLFIVAAIFISGPNAFALTDGKLRYRTTFTIKRWAGEKYGKTVRATLTVADLQKVELQQNALEKKRNLGRAIFYGQAKVDFAEEQDVLVEYAEKGYDVNDIKLPAKHAFGGIQNFDQFREEVNAQVKNAAVLYNDSYEVRG